MEIDEKEKTAPGSSVGADEGQPIQKDNNTSISNSDPKINDPASKTKESMRDKRRKMQSMFDPNSLYTISMTELYQNTYKSRSAIIEGVLYPGTYLLAGAPKIGKSFLVAQLAYHVSTGKEFSIWHWKMITADYRNECIGCLGRTAVKSCSLLPVQNRLGMDLRSS